MIESKKYNYIITSYLLKYLINFVYEFNYNNRNNINCYINSNYFILFYDIICIILHSINHNYKKLTDIFTKINYEMFFKNGGEYHLLQFYIALLTDVKLFNN